MGEQAMGERTTRRRGRRRGPGPAVEQAATARAVAPGLMGGAYKPLGSHDMERIHATALDVLENIGMADPIPELRELALAKGCAENAHGRLCFPRGLVEDIVAGAGRDFVHHGRDPKHDLEISGARVHFGGGGEAVMMVDFETGRFRPSTALDLYDMGRLVDRLEHIHFFGRLVVARELDDLFEHDVNLAYATLAGTTKPVGIGAAKGRHVPKLIEMLDMVAGGEGKFRTRPFSTVFGCPVVSPLRFGVDNSEVLIAGARAGAPVDVVIAPQAGSTGPAALAGTLVQTVAETLAGLVMVNLACPGHPVIFGVWPLISDLRTGAFTGGGGEEALVTAAAAQLGNFYDLPCSVAAGMSDANVPDAQAGFENGVTVALAGLAGANMVEEAAGFVGNVMGCSFEGLVIDNDMLGNIQRAIRGIEVTDETLSYSVIEETVYGPGHYLSHPQTLALMHSEYLYPEISDRRSPEEWEEEGRPDIRERARARVREILSSHYPVYIEPAADDKIRERFPIRLPHRAMRPDCGRW